MFRNDTDGYSERKLILGTHTSDSEKNHLMIAKVLLPLDGADVDITKYDESQGG